MVPNALFSFGDFPFFCFFLGWGVSKLRGRGRRATWTRAAEPPAGVPPKARPHFEACNARAGARGDRGSKPDRLAPSSPIFSGAQASQAGRSAAGPRASLLSGCHEQVTGSQGRGGGRGRRRLGRCCVLVSYVTSGQANCLSEQDGEALTAPGWPRSGKRHGKVRKYY